MINKSMKMTIGKLNNVNYYNNSQNLIRVKLDNNKDDIRYYDLPLIYTGEYPNPALHHVLIFTYDDMLELGLHSILPDDPKLEQIPGYFDEDNLTNRITNGYCILLNDNIKHNLASGNVGQMGNFNTSSNLTSNPNNIRNSMSAPLNKSYTTTEGEYVGEKNLDNVGVFITDNSLLLKASGGSILLGPDGISIFGKRSETHTTESKGMMAKNPIGTLIPPTLMSFPAAIEYIPDMDFIAAIGNNVNRMAHTAILSGKVVSAVSNIV